MLPGIVALRAAALKKHANAVSKVSRLKARGVDVAGTEFDPRRPWATVKRYNSKQLESYMERLDRFNARTFRLNALADRKPLPLGRWEQYQRTERQYNRKVDSALDRIGDLVPPGSGLSLRQREDMRKSVNGTANTENTILHTTNRKPQYVKDMNALEKLEAQLVRRMSDEYQIGQIQSSRVSAEKMVDAIGAQDINDALAELSDEQFDILWSRTRFRDTLIAVYVEDEDSKDNTHVGYDLDDARQLISWAKGLRL